VANFTGRKNFEKFQTFAISHQQELTKHANITTGSANITLTSAITAGSTVTCVGAFDTDGYSRIVGTVRSSQNATLKIYQGLGTDSNYNELFSVTITSGTSEGAGQRFNVPVLGDSAKITITNDGGADLTSLAFEAFLQTLDPGLDQDSASSVSISSPVGGGTEAAAVRVTIANDSTGLVSVDDNGGSLTVDGTVTANAGTNLNTSALALETGGNLASAVTALQIMDDWDESDRAKVNIIAGQSGVEGGTGVVSATTQRVTLATDVALPAGTNAIGKLAANSGVDIGDVDVTSVTLPAASEASTGAWTSAGSSAQEASRVVKASAGRLRLLVGYNAKASAQFIQVHNTTSLPADAAVPIYSFTVPATSNFSLDLGETAGYFGTGITVCNSSTQATKTIGSADCWFNALYA